MGKPGDPNSLKQKMNLIKEGKFQRSSQGGDGKKHSLSAQTVPRIFHWLYHLIEKPQRKVGFGVLTAMGSNFGSTPLELRRFEPVL